MAERRGEPSYNTGDWGGRRGERGCKNYSAATEPTAKETVTDAKNRCAHPLSFCLALRASADVVLPGSDKVMFYRVSHLLQGAPLHRSTHSPWSGGSALVLQWGGSGATVFTPWL